MKWGTWQHLYYFTLVKFAISTMLKVNQCGIYDAEFSQIKYDHRLTGDLTDTLFLVSLRQCLTKCMLHTTCKSVNYIRQNETCELSSSLSYKTCDLPGVVYQPAKGWNHFQTDIKKRAVGSRCAVNNPCQDFERCEDTCNGGQQCVMIGAYLQSCLNGPFTQSTTYSVSHPANKAFDMNEQTYSHTSGNKGVSHWIKVQFGGRQFFVSGIEVVNRVLSSHQSKRNDNADIISILNGVETKVGNIGELGLRRSYGVMRKADALKLYYDASVAAEVDGIMNFMEIWVNGWIE
ncbi:uncharacterized protein [Clytia hemisphaerica]